jgi:CheY-like chemotaxis protein
VTKDCLLIALTGYGQSRDRTRSAEGGFQYHLVKPVDIVKLIKILNSDGAVAASDALGAP